jgi:hypothetical protein
VGSEKGVMRLQIGRSGYFSGEKLLLRCSFHALACYAHAQLLSSIPIPSPSTMDI